MRRSESLYAAAAAFGLVLWAIPATGTPRQAIIVDPAEANQNVAITDVEGHDGVVTGTIVNRSSEPVRDVKLLIDYVWLWNNERHPGDASPGRSDFFTVHGEIPPRGNLPFTYQGPPLPERRDGRFETHVQITQFTEVETAAADQPRSYEHRGYQHRPAPHELGHTYTPPEPGTYQPPVGAPDSENGDRWSN